MDHLEHTRGWNREARARALADMDARAVRLSPAVVGHWTKQIEKAAPLVKSGKRPCHYGPWTVALAKARGAPIAPDTLKEMYDGRLYNSELMAFAEDIGSPAWPKPRRDLIDFALLFIEADVMLFRSGYTKRHLLTRLCQSPLTPKDIDRLDAMLRRVVGKGAGLEVFRALCRLAGHLINTGHLSEFREWVDGQASGAVLTLSMADGGLWRQISEASLSDADRRKIENVRWFGPSKWGVAWPEMDRAVPNIDDNDHRVRRNAWRIGDAIRRRLGGRDAR